jgi:type VI secretion system protein ImpE
MTPLALYREGRLREAIKALGEELRSNPLDAKRRTFLFELLLFAGEYDRAEKQLDLLAGANADAAAGTLLYRSALHAERTRQACLPTMKLLLKDEPVMAEHGMGNRSAR